MRRIVIILLSDVTLAEKGGVIEGLAELGKVSSFSFDLVLIETPGARVERDATVASLKLEPGDCVSLSFVEARSDSACDLIEATNEALRRAAGAKLDAIVMGPCIFPDREAILELCSVGEQDPMVGFVEGGVSDGDHRPLEDSASSRASAYQRADILEGMPRLSYVPDLKEPFVLIRARILQEFDLLDGAFNSLMASLKDFALRANRCGYRVVRANHARARAWTQAKADGASDQRDEEKLRACFPYLAEEVRRFEASPQGRVWKLSEGLRADEWGKLNIVFDCSNLGKIYNGTSELAKRVITEFTINHSDQYNIHVLCSREAFEFQGYGRLAGVSHLNGVSDADEARFFASIRLVQPFRDEDIALLAKQAPVTIMLVLDTIAIDCMQISPWLGRIWERMLKSTSAVGFISDFSRLQFERRFLQGDHLGFTALCSTDTQEYRAGKGAGEPRDDGYVLLVGNPYEHKFLKASCELFHREAPGVKLVVLGLKMPNDDQISSYESGQLSDEAAADLYARASVVFFPSHCEGFGLPIMHGLAHRKPVIARDLPVFREIKERVREARNLHLFEATLDMVRFAVARPVWDAREIEPPRTVQRWSDMTNAIVGALVEAGRRLTYRDLHNRLLSAEACEEIGRLEEMLANRSREIAEMKLRWEPPVDEADIPGQAARFMAKRLESRLRSLLGRKWVYSLTRSGWRALRGFPRP